MGKRFSAMGEAGVSGFYSGKKVFITGHTGFKGTWLCALLMHLGAEVTGYALEPPTEPSLFALSGMQDRIHSVCGDIRDLEKLEAAMQKAQPELVFHLAAQPLVRESYRKPVLTYETNVMGTVHLMEAVRETGSVRSLVNVTTDKVYFNEERESAYREEDRLCGRDPYSNSKSCSELVTEGYREAFLGSRVLAVSTARAGNVIGGGDFAKDRIVPDCIRDTEAGRSILVRNPRSVRPYQHVLEPLFAYLLLAEKQEKNANLAGSYNIGPDPEDIVSTAELADIFCKAWGEGARWEFREDKGPREAGILRLDCRKAKEKLDWKPVWNVRKAIERTVEWEKKRLSGADPFDLMTEQIREYGKDTEQ